MQFTKVIAACAVVSACLSSTCVAQADTSGIGIRELTPTLIVEIDHLFRGMIDDRNINTAGIAIIKNAEVAWTGYYGLQRPGISASKQTQFNVGSITKTVTTETILRLVEQGKLDLDESMAPYWVDPDVAEDPRHKNLTPRMVLTHTSGFMNWRFLADDFKLRFVSDPGATFGYSGEAFKYLASYAEKKLGRSFESLVQEQVFGPVGIENASVTVREENFPNIAMSLEEGGDFPGYYCFPQKRWCRQEASFSAAGDMVIAVEDYAKFLISVMNNEGYSEPLSEDRNRVQGDENKATKVDCSSVSKESCPKEQGYGLGWEVFDYPETKLVSHGGSDWSLITLAYFYTDSRDGLIIFLNAPNKFALGAMPAPLEQIDPLAPFAAHYRRIIARDE